MADLRTHYARAAERCLSEAVTADSATAQALLLSTAQVYATLAVAYSTPAPAPGGDG